MDILRMGGRAAIAVGLSMGAGSGFEGYQHSQESQELEQEWLAGFSEEQIDNGILIFDEELVETRRARDEACAIAIGGVYIAYKGYMIQRRRRDNWMDPAASK